MSDKMRSFLRTWLIVLRVIGVWLLGALLVVWLLNGLVLLIRLMFPEQPAVELAVIAVAFLLMVSLAAAAYIEWS